MKQLVIFLLRFSPRIAVCAVVAGIIAGVGNTGLLAVINAALNRSGSAKTDLLWIYCALCFVLLASRSVSWVLLIQLAQRTTFNLRLRLAKQILAAPLRQLETLGAPRLLTSLTDDVTVIANALILIPIFCVHAAVVASCMIYLGWLSWQVLLGVLCFMLVGVLCYQIPLSKALRYLGKSRHELDALLKHFRALTEGVKELKLNRARRDAFLDEHLEITAESYRRNASTAAAIYAAAASFGQLLIFILIGLLLFGLPVWRETDAQILTGYCLVILYMMTPLDVIMNSLPSFGRASLALGKIEELGLSLKANAGETSEENRGAELTAFAKLELLNVRHSYRHDSDEQNFTLDLSNLSFRSGEIVFLIGGNGSGKSTLAKVFTGLYPPEAGEIRLDGQPITDQNRESYRQLFSVVFSDFYLFENLLGLLPLSLDASAQDYLKRLQLAHKVQVKNGAFSTVALSQGQRKRLALLTAYLEDRPFYVFDEWAADQDPLFKEIFYLQILPELKARGKTVLVISHDDRYYRVADRIVKLNYGKIEEVIADDSLKNAAEKSR